MPSKIHLRSLSNFFPLIFIFIANQMNMSNAELTDSLKRAAKTQEGEKWCPVKLAGTQCPSGSIFHYYRCCGHLNNDCCFNIQSWLLLVLIGIVIMIVASAVLTILRCVFCRRK